MMNNTLLKKDFWHKGVGTDKYKTVKTEITNQETGYLKILKLID